MKLLKQVLLLKCRLVSSTYPLPPITQNATSPVEQMLQKIPSHYIGEIMWDLARDNRSSLQTITDQHLVCQMSQNFIASRTARVYIQITAFSNIQNITGKHRYNHALYQAPDYKNCIHSISNHILTNFSNIAKTI